jgi:hypothetical protein
LDEDEDENATGLGMSGFWKNMATMMLAFNEKTCVGGESWAVLLEGYHVLAENTCGP